VRTRRALPIGFHELNVAMPTNHLIAVPRGRTNDAQRDEGCELAATAVYRRPGSHGIPQEWRHLALT
jgi:hypothetical protein